MPDPQRTTPLSVARPGYGVISPSDTRLIRLLVRFEYVLLHLTAFVLLVIGAAVLFLTITAALHGPVSWPERLIVVIEELLLVLIIIEIFVTV
jgi:hypothetical protein